MRSARSWLIKERTPGDLEELGVSVGLSSVYRTLESMGYSCLSPRPRHEKQDPAAQQRFKEESAPFCLDHPRGP